MQDDQNDSKDAPVSDNSVPPIKQTKINTQAIVGAGQSLLIGGYYYEQKSTDASGIPILMHIPVLGNLFKTTTDEATHGAPDPSRRRLSIWDERIDDLFTWTEPHSTDRRRRPIMRNGFRRAEAGCSRKRPELETVTPATAIVVAARGAAIA